MRISQGPTTRIALRRHYIPDRDDSACQLTIAAKVLTLEVSVRSTLFLLALKFLAGPQALAVGCSNRGDAIEIALSCGSHRSEMSDLSRRASPWSGSDRPR